MDWKKFFKPQISKVIIFILIVLISGVPASVEQCATYDFGTGEFPCGPTRFGIHNPFSEFLVQMLDAVNIYSYNPILVGVYLMALYSLLSLIYFYTKKNRTQRTVCLSTFIILFFMFGIFLMV